MAITEFRGKYFPFSNFFNQKVEYNNLTFINNEAAFQAQKTLDEDIKKEFCNIFAGDAKRKGKEVNLREDWESIKDNIMYELVLYKFSQNKNLKLLLIETGQEELIEGNSWGDDYWGVPFGKTGQNKLGKILMRVRSELK